MVAGEELPSTSCIGVSSSGDGALRARSSTARTRRALIPHSSPISLAGTPQAARAMIAESLRALVAAEPFGPVASAAFARAAALSAVPSAPPRVAVFPTASPPLDAFLAATTEA